MWFGRRSSPGSVRLRGRVEDDWGDLWQHQAAVHCTQHYSFALGATTYINVAFSWVQYTLVMEQMFMFDGVLQASRRVLKCSPYDLCVGVRRHRAPL